MCKKLLIEDKPLQALSHKTSLMYYCASLQDVRTFYTESGSGIHLNRLSALTVSATSQCRLSKESLYFVSFFGNSHGSWVEIKTGMVKYSSVRLNLESICSRSGFYHKYPCTPVILSNLTQDQILQQHNLKPQSYLLWIESYNWKTCAKFNIRLETEIAGETDKLQDATMKLEGFIQQNAWEGNVILSAVNPVFCFVLPGVPLHMQIAKTNFNDRSDSENNCSDSRGVLQLFWAHDYSKSNNLGLQEDSQIYIHQFTHPWERAYGYKSLHSAAEAPKNFEYLQKIAWYTNLTVRVHIVVTALPHFYCAKSKETTSWYMASKICRTMGATLPILKTRGEMETFVAFLGRLTQSVRKELPSERSKEIVLIGLKKSSKYQVSTLLFGFSPS